MKKIIPFLVLITVFHSCDVVVDLDIEDHTPVLVLNSILNPDSIAAISLSHSLGAFEQGSIAEVKNATVHLYENDNYLADATYVENEYEVGAYQFDGFYPTPGKSYKIEAEHDNYETVYANSTIPELVPINNLTIDSVIEYQDEFMIDYTANVTFSFEDHPQQENYYMLELIYEDEYYSYPRYFFSNDASFGSSMGVDSEYAFEGDVAIFSDNLFNGGTKSIEFGYWSYIHMYEGEEIEQSQMKLKFSNITKEYYLYKKSRLASRGSDDFFGGEPIQVYTNIQNGLGVLVAKSTDEHLIE